MHRRRMTTIAVLLGTVTLLRCAIGAVRQAEFPIGSIRWAGLERTYRIHVPPSYDKTRPMPLVIALHGGGGTGEKMEKLSLGGFNTLSDKEGFVVVYPDGIKRHWNDGRSAEETGWQAHKENIDDVGLMSALIDYFIKELNIDKGRVYVTGISNGALMSYRLACELTGKIAAIAPVAGTMANNLYPHCSPSRAISLLAIHGTKDPLAPWEGGLRGFAGKKLGRALSVADTFKYWKTHNRCPSASVITYEPDKNPQDGTKVRREVYSGCKDGTEVILYAIEGGGHTWPNGYQYLPELLVGKTSKDIDANEVIWNFFKTHSLK